MMRCCLLAVMLAASPSIGGAGPLAHLHEHQRAVAITHDQVDFAAAAPGRPIIPLQQLQTRHLQMGCGTVLAGIADVFL